MIAQSGVLSTTRGNMMAAPRSAPTLARGLTHSLDSTKDGLAVNATRTALPIDLSTVDIKAVLARFDQSKSGGCWPWTGGTGKAGYGLVSRGRSRTRLLAHRVVYTILRGPIPGELPLDHLCRNRICVNPAHLEPVTVGENNRRGFGASGIHARQTHCVHGHEFTAENTAILPSGSRKCHACSRERDRRRPSGWARGRAGGGS